MARTERAAWTSHIMTNFHPDASLPEPSGATSPPLVLRTSSSRNHVRRVSSAFFRDVVGSLRNGVIVITNRGALAHINREACRILGLPHNVDDSIGRPYVDVLSGSPEIVRILRSAFELTNPPNRAETRLGRSNRVIGYTVCSVRDPEGHVTGAALLFKDLTRLEQLEERERLRDRLAALGEMAATIAHEVKNPLAGIKVMAGLLKRRLAGAADAEDLLNDIINEAKMADAIVLEILEFVRPLRLEVEPLSVPRLLHDALRLAQNRSGPNEITVVIDVDAAVPEIEADGAQLRQLFTNLLTNAFDALDTAGHVRVEARLKAAELDPDSTECTSLPRMVEICVRDNGPGIPEDLRDRVFSPFFTTKAKGSGLGLAIVRKIVDAHEGRIDLVADNAGTCFRVTLPVTVAREIASPFGSAPRAPLGN